MFGKILSLTVNICAYEFRVYSFLYVIKYIIVNDYLCHLCGVILTLKSNGCDNTKTTDLDEHIDLINTLGDMVDQKEEAKKENFIETMPTMIQTHLIMCKDWAVVKDTAKSLKHIILKCDPPTPAMPMMATDATVPGLYSHITHLVDKEEGEIPQPIKGAKPKQTRGRGKPKEKPQEQRQNPPKAQEASETYTYENPNNYYHNAPSQSQGHRPYNGQGGNRQFRGFIQ